VFFYDPCVIGLLVSSLPSNRRQGVHFGGDTLYDPSRTSRCPLRRFGGTAFRRSFHKDVPSLYTGCPCYIYSSKVCLAKSRFSPFQPLFLSSGPSKPQRGSRTHIEMTLYLPSAQAKKGDEYLDDARALRDLWRDVIPRGELTSLQNRLTMSACYILVQIWLVFTFVSVSRAAEMRATLDSKRGFSKISHARTYCKYAQEVLQATKVLIRICKVKWALIDAFRRLLAKLGISQSPKIRMTSSKSALQA
jgi:hypothetical protein